MKKTTIQLLVLVMALVTFLSCAKDRGIKAEPEMDEKNLTDCPANATCQYLFSENVNLDPQAFSVREQGSYRLFWAEVKQNSSTSAVYVKAPMEGTRFELKKADVLAERVLFSRSCPSCSMIPFKVIDGYVKGVNLTPGKRADQTKWLLEIKVVIQYEGSSIADETIFIKQYFFPNFVYN